MSDPKDPEPNRVLNITPAGLELTVEAPETVSYSFEGDEHSRVGTDTASSESAALSEDAKVEERDAQTGNMRFVNQYDAGGGYALNLERADGQQEFTVGNRYPIGKRSQGHIVEVFVAALRSQGVQASRTPFESERDEQDADQRGVDAYVLADGVSLQVQVVMGVFGQEFWAPTQTTNSSVSGSAGAAQFAAWIHRSITEKKQKYGKSAREIVLLVDLHAMPLAASAAIGAAYYESFGSTGPETGFKAVWLIGDGPQRVCPLYRLSGQSHGAW